MCASRNQTRQFILYIFIDLWILNNSAWLGHTCYSLMVVAITQNKYAIPLQSHARFVKLTILLGHV